MQNHESEFPSKAKISIQIWNFRDCVSLSLGVARKAPSQKLVTQACEMNRAFVQWPNGVFGLFREIPFGEVVLECKHKRLQTELTHIQRKITIKCKP